MNSKDIVAVYLRVSTVDQNTAAQEQQVREYAGSVVGDRRAYSVILGELQARNVALICTSQGIDTSTPNPVAQLQLGVLMAVAEFERALIKERTMAGLAVARMNGKRIGRPPRSSRKVRHILKISRRLGGKIRAIAREVAVAPSTVSRVLSRTRLR